MLPLIQSNEFVIDGRTYLIKVVKVSEEKSWFKADDVCKALGYRITKDALRRHVQASKDKRSLNDLIRSYDLDLGPDFRRDRGGQQPYVSKEGFELLVSKCKTMVPLHMIQYLIETFKLNVNIVDFSKEQKYIGFILDAFRHERHKTQYRVGSYRIDLYFIDKKIAVECDELGHSDRCPQQEQRRQEYIEGELSCKFIRFNPDAKDFELSNVVNQLIRAMY